MRLSGRSRPRLPTLLVYGGLVPCPWCAVKRSRGPHLWNPVAMKNLNLRMHGCRAFVVALVLALTTAGGLLAAPGVASAAGLTSFNVGVLEPRQVVHKWWNNANGDAYAPGLEATGADNPNAFCLVGVKRTWYQRNPSGEREFHLEIEGDNNDRYQVTAWLARLTKYRESTTSTLSPGESWSSHWNNAHADQNVYVVGVLPPQASPGAL